MPSVNKVILLGNVGRDPEVRYLPSGKAVATFSLATSTRRKDKNTGETLEETAWHRVTCYERLAEIAGEYVKKGRPVYIEGSIKYGKYTDQSGVEKTSVDIIAREMQLLGSGSSEDRGGAPRTPVPAKTPPAGRQGPDSSGFDDMSDDVPF